MFKTLRDLSGPLPPLLDPHLAVTQALGLAAEYGTLLVADEAGRPAGVLDAADFCALLAAGKGGESLGAIAKPVHFAPESAKAELTATHPAIVVTGKDGLPTGFAGPRDLCAKAPALYAIRLEKLQGALDAAYNAIVAVDAKGRVIAGNNAFWSILGIDAEKGLGQAIQNLVPSTGLPEVLRTGEPNIGVPVTIRGKNYLSNRTPLRSQGRLVGAVAVLQDVTDLETTRAELKEATHLKSVLETVLDTAYEGIVVVDEHCRVTMFNRAYGDFLGLDPDAVIGKDVRAVIENTRMHEVVRTGKAELRRVQRIKGNDMLCDRIPLLEGGRVVGAVGKVLFRDVSELERLLSQTQSLKNELEYYKDELRRRNGTRFSLESIVGDSWQLHQLKELTRQVARSATTVLIGGESGTGKELFAHAIHNLSARSARPFVKVNCAAMPEALLESELFGYREGAFTGARKGGKIGKFELAHGGTILLDEIGEMPLAMQVKLLRVLQEKEIERLGDNALIPTDVRIIAATNRNLLRMVETGEFRADLYYRLNVITLDVPALRDRAQDISSLARHFLAKHCHVSGCEEKRLSPDTLEVLESYRWPGNVRELENVLERAVTLCQGEEILPAHLPLVVRAGSGRRPGVQPLRQVMEEVEAEHLRLALHRAGGNALKAARLLGIGKTSLYDKLARYGIPTGPV